MQEINKSNTNTNKEYSREDREKWAKNHIQNYKQVLTAINELKELNQPTTPSAVIKHMVDQWEAKAKASEEEEL